MSKRAATLGIATALAILLIGGQPAPARADLIMQVDNSTASAGGTGTFDVVLIDTGGVFPVSSFSVELSVLAASGINFTGVNTNTLAAPYIFGTLQTPPFSFSAFPTTDFTASDLDATPPGFRNLNPGDVVGLAHVSFSVNPATPLGPVIVTIVPANTLVADVTGAPIPFTPVNGTITIVPTTVSTPEPSSLALAAIGAGGLLFAFRRRKAAGLRQV